MKSIKVSAICTLFCLFFAFSVFSSSAQDSQSGWRWCNKCQGLFFGDNPGSFCPAAGAHNSSGSGNYSVLFANSQFEGQEGWRWCKKCQGLFFSMQGKPSVCPKGNAHDGSSSGSYKMLDNVVPGYQHQSGWKWCNKCGVAFFSKNPASKCPAGNSHDGSASGGYYLIEGGPVSTQLTVADNVRQFPFEGGEIQSTVIPPGKKTAKCPNGRILISNDLQRPPTLDKAAGPVIGRNLNDTIDTVIQSTFDPVPNGVNYVFGTNDHDLVSLSNGDVFYITGAWSRVPVSPTKTPAWWYASYRGDFGPGARGVALAWRSTDCGETFQFVPGLEFGL